MRSTGWLVPAAFILIVALAAGLRLYRLDARSLWLDEILSAEPAHLNSPGDVVAWSQAAINQMPLFYEFTWLVGHWGDNSVLLRLPATIAGILIIPAVFVTGRRLFSDRVGLFAALVAAVMPFLIWYSQEARNYSLLMLLTTLQMYFAYGAIKHGRLRDWGGLAAFSVLNLYTHYLALLATGAIAVYVGAFVATDLMRISTRAVRATAGIVVLVAAAIALFVPWRATLRSAYNVVADLLASPVLHGKTAALAIVMLLALLAGGAAFLRSRSQTFKLTAAGNAIGVLLVAILALRLGGLATSSGHIPVRYVAAAAVIGIATAVAVVIAVLDLLQHDRAVSRRFELALLTGAVIGLAYAPWLPTLRTFLGRPDQSLGQIHLAHSPNLADIASLVSLLGLTGAVIVALLIGLAVLVRDVGNGRAAESGVVLASIGVPLLAILAVTRAAIVGIDVRYLSFIFPAAILAMAVGIDATAVWAARLLRVASKAPLAQRSAAFVAAALVLVVVLAQAVPALGRSYATPKEDYRAAAAHVAASSSPGSVLLAVGAYSDWAVICFDYYLRQMHSDVMVADGMQLDSDVTARLTGNAAVWGVVIFPSAAQLAALSSPSTERTDFVDVTGLIHVVRATDTSLPPAVQASQLLKWEQPLEPQLMASVELLDLATGAARIGDNLLASPSVAPWTLTRGASVDDTGAFYLRAPTAADEVDASIAVPVEAGRDYRLVFAHQGSASPGWQAVYAIAYDGSGHPLTAFPTGAGYVVRPSDSWRKSFFAFNVPAAATQLEIILRVHGPGTGQFRDVELATMTASP